MDPFIGEIRMFGGSFAPANWAFCNGQLLPISQNAALFSLLGTTYGGNGVNTFGLPDLRGRVPVHAGNSAGPGLQPVVQGEVGGSASVTLLQTQMPIHTHQATFAGTGAAPLAVTIPVASADASVSDPNGNIPAKFPGATRGTYQNIYAPTSAATSGAKLGGVTATGGGFTGGTVAVAAAGGSQPVPTMPPFLGINFIIALQGIFPSRN